MRFESIDTRSGILAEQVIRGRFQSLRHPV
jgi:hypothetical protein